METAGSVKKYQSSGSQTSEGLASMSSATRSRSAPGAVLEMHSSIFITILIVFVTIIVAIDISITTIMQFLQQQRRQQSRR